MPKLVSQIVLDFEDHIPKVQNISLTKMFKNAENASAVPALGSQAPQNTKMNKPKMFTNYSYFLTISMKNNFVNAQAFYNCISEYIEFLKINRLVEEMYISFEFYKSTNTKLHAHAIIEFADHTKKLKLYKSWTKEYFKIVHDITINSINFKIKQISDYKEPDVNITWNYVNKDVHIMDKLKFDPLYIKTQNEATTKVWKRKKNKHLKITKDYLNIINLQLKSFYKSKKTLKEINDYKKTLYS